MKAKEKKEETPVEEVETTSGVVQTDGFGTYHN